MPHRSIKHKTLFPFFLVVLVFTLLLGVISYRVLRSTGTEHDRQMLTLLAESTAARVAQEVSRREREISALANSDAAERYAQDYAFYSLSRMFRDHSSQFSVLTFVNAQGMEEERVVAGQISENYRDISHTALYRSAVSSPNEVMTSGVEIGVWREPTLSFIYEHRDFFGNFGGIIRGAAPIKDIVMPASQTRVGALGFVLVLDDEGRVLAYPDKNRLLSVATGDDAVSQALVVAAMNGGRGFGFATILGVSSAVAYAPIPGLPWSLLATLPYDEVIEAANSLRTTIALISLATLALLFAIGVVLSRMITEPLGELLKVTGSITRGDFSVRARVHSDDELQALADAFNHMIDERQESEERLRKARDEARSAARAKADFMARVSHEIRTPMNGVVAMTDYLLQGELDPRQRECASMIQSSSDHLLRIVNEVVEYSRLESGRLELEEGEFSLADAVRNTAEIFTSQASRKGLEIVPVIRPGAEQLVRGDEGRLKQVLFNLVGNAIRFTAAGQIVIVASVRSQADAPRLRCEVRDSGIGIAPEHHVRIFDSFTQANSSTTRIFGGSGLGLAICKELVHLMNGEIGVISSEGKGATFWFELPIGGVGERPSDAQETQELAGLRALVAADEPTTRSAINARLASWHVRSTCAGTQRDAMELTGRRAGTDDAFDVIIIDSTLAGRDGMALAREIRDTPGLVQPRILMLHPDAPVEGQHAFEDFDAGGSAPEPSGRQDLETALRRCVATRKGKPAEQRARAKRAPRPMYRASILVAEDDPMNQRVARRLLEHFGCRVAVVANGQEAVDAFSDGDFDLVFMDYQMPVMDGAAAAGLIRSFETGRGTRHTPIVALSANIGAGGLDAHMDGFVAKPYDLAEIGRALARWVPHTRRLSSAA